MLTCSSATSKKRESLSAKGRNSNCSPNKGENLSLGEVPCHWIGWLGLQFTIVGKNETMSSDSFQAKCGGDGQVKQFWRGPRYAMCNMPLQCHRIMQNLNWYEPVGDNFRDLFCHAFNWYLNCAQKLINRVDVISVPLQDGSMCHISALLA